MPTINVLDATGATVAVNTPNADGPLPMAESRSVTLASDQTAIPIAGYDPVGDKLLVGTARDRFFDNFADFDTSPTGHWEVLETGPGMTITGPLGGAAAGSTPYINIASGVTVGKTVILSRAMFTAPVDLRYQITASQRIANNRLLIGFVQVDEDGAILTDTTRATAPSVLNARNAVMQMHDGTTTTTAQLLARAAGSALDQVSNAFGTGFATAATGTGPNWISATTYGLTVERDRINSRAYGQNVLTNTGGQFAHDRVVPNPNARYKLCIIVENNGVPASTTDWRIHLINLMDATRFDVSPRTGGLTDGSKAFPMWAVGGSVGISGSVSAAVAGSIAEDAATTASPVIVGGVVRDATAPTTLIAGDAARATMSRGAALVVKPYAVAETGWAASLALTTTTAAPIQAAGGAGLKRHITAIQAINTGAGVVDLIILDGTTERWRLPLPINVPVTIQFATELPTTAATALNANLSAAGAVRLNAQGYTSA